MCDPSHHDDAAVRKRLALQAACDPNLNDEGGDDDVVAGGKGTPQSPSMGHISHAGGGGNVGSNPVHP